jgi:hypothetical protein
MGATNRQEATACVQITGLTWIVEPSFAWLGRNRRLSKDYAYWVQTSETMIDLAAIRLMLNRDRAWIRLFKHLLAVSAIRCIKTFSRFIRD